MKTLEGGKLVADFYQWPVFLAILPPLLSIYYGGKMEEWSEGFMLVIVAFYLYGLIKLPWELYVSAKRRSVSINKVAVAYSSRDIDGVLTHPAEVQRLRSIARLRHLEYFYLALVFLAPLSGAIFIRYIRPHLQLYQNLINGFPMALYVLTSYIRPLIHLARLLKQHAADLHEEAYYPHLEIQQLTGRVQQLELQVDEMRLLVLASDTEGKLHSVLQTHVEPQLKDLNKDIRKTARKERKFMDFSMEKFRELETKVLQQDTLIAHMQETYYMPPVEHHHHHRSILLLPVYWAMNTLPVRAVMFPINAFLRFSSWVLPESISRMIPHGTDSKHNAYSDDEPLADRGRVKSQPDILYLKAESDGSRSASPTAQLASPLVSNTSSVRDSATSLRTRFEPRR